MHIYHQIYRFSLKRGERSKTWDILHESTILDSLLGPSVPFNVRVQNLNLERDSLPAMIDRSSLMSQSQASQSQANAWDSCWDSWAALTLLFREYESLSAQKKSRDDVIKFLEKLLSSIKAEVEKDGIVQISQKKQQIVHFLKNFVERDIIQTPQILVTSVAGPLVETLLLVSKGRVNESGTEEERRISERYTHSAEDFADRFYWSKWVFWISDCCSASLWAVSLLKPLLCTRPKEGGELRVLGDNLHTIFF